MIEALGWLGRLPLLARAGLAWLAAALVVDVLIHVAIDHGLASPVMDVLEYAAHVGVLAGMVLIYLGVLVGGVRKPRRPDPAAPREGVR